MAPGARFAKIKKRVSQWTKRWDNSSGSSVAPGDTTTISIPSFSAFSMLRPLSRVPTNSDGSAKSIGKPSVNNPDPGYTISSMCLPSPQSAAPNTMSATVESSASTRMATRASTRASAQAWSQFANENTILETSLPAATPTAADRPCLTTGPQTSGTPSKRKRVEPDADVKPNSGILQKCTSQTGFDEWWSRTIKTACADGARTCGRGSAQMQDTGDQEMLTMAWAISQFSCHLCGKRIPVDAASLVRNMQSILPGDASSPSGSVYSSFKCQQCAIMNCLACARATPSPLSDDQTPPEKLPSITWCCDMGRIMLILSLCCGVGYNAASPPPTPTPASESGRHSFGFFKTLKEPKPGPPPSALDTSSEPPSKKHLHKVTTKKVFPKKQKSATPKGVGYGSTASLYCPTGLIPAPSITQSSLLEEDCKYEMYFRMLCHLLSHSEHLPELNSPAASSFTLLYHILSRSPLMTKTAELLLNTSIEDMTKRHSLYETLCQFLSILGNNETLTRLVTEPRRVFPEEEQVAQICFMSPEMIAAMRTSFDGKGKHKVRETSDPLAVLLGRISVMCQFVLQKSTVHSSDYLSVDGIQTLSMCRRLISLSERFVPAPPQPAPNTRSTAITRASTRKASSAADAKSQAELSAAWHREHCVEDIDDEKMMENNYFENHTQMMRHSPKGRMKRLVNEINMLRSSLPEGIYVRHGSGRLDTMKVLIIGPKGTPYENGLFEFDLFCSNNFPQSPPYMRLRTTGGGQVRFNPNLYADGTVCLSLLGTWAQGQSWEPDQSTLLQVLVSIQAMIFCEEPYYNEPGREEKRNPQASAKENAFLQKSTVQHAMLYWLNMLSPYGPSDTNASSPQIVVWEDVVRKHFTLHGQTIMQVVSKWGIKDDGVRQLRDTLRQHAFLE